MRRRYSDFEWLRNELERDSKVSREPAKYILAIITEYASFVDCGAPTAWQGMETTNALPR